MEIKLEIIENLKDKAVGLESIHADLSIECDELVFSYIVYINDLCVKFSEWAYSPMNSDFIFEDSLEFLYIFGVKRNNQQYYFEGYNGITFRINSITEFCKCFMTALEEAYARQGEIGKKYYKEVCDLRIQDVD